MQPHETNFVVISDLHVTHSSPGDKLPLRDKIISVINDKKNISTIIVVGDLTDNGNNDEFVNWLSFWYTPLDDCIKKYGGEIYACLGNHDIGGNLWYKDSDIVKWMKNEFGHTDFYTFDINDVHFICCGMCPVDDGIGGCCCCPRPDTLKKLANDLADNSDRFFVIFWHYNSVGTYSDFWSQSDKDKVYKILLPYKNKILCIFNGHLHKSKEMLWGDLRTVLAAGNAFALANVIDGRLKYEFISA